MQGLETIPRLDLRLDTAEQMVGKNFLNELVDSSFPTIGLFTYATGKKCYSEAWWRDLYQMLLVKFPKYNIVEVLPIENISNLSRQAPTFYSTDIRELAGFIANMSVMIAADSGIMHLASASPIATVGLFSVTNPKRYEPYNKNSIAIDTTNTPIKNIIGLIDIVLKNEKAAHSIE